MALGSVQINALNLAQGEPTEVENYFLYIGVGDGVASDTLLFLNTESDLDVELGATDTELKRNIAAARLNAGQDWNCVAYELGTDTWSQALDKVIAANIVVEAVVICTPVTTQAELAAMQAKAVSVWSSFAMRLFFIATTAKIDQVSQTWAQYITALSALTTGAVADRVTVTPQIYTDSIGVYAGRLSNKAQRVSDSPMRVASGALVGKLESYFPIDELGIKFNNAHAKALNDARFAVPQTYHGYEGVYFSDGATLDLSTGDYAVIENLRVVDFIARKIYLILILMIGDRSINSTPVSMAYATNKLMQPLFTAAKSFVFAGKPFPGDINTPKDGDVSLFWETRTKLIVYLKVTPFNCPKAIEGNIILDLSTV